MFNSIYSFIMKVFIYVMAGMIGYRVGVCAQLKAGAVMACVVLFVYLTVLGVDGMLKIRRNKK